MINIKPYKDITEAIRRYKSNYYLREGSIKLDLKSNLSNAERILIDGTYLAKILYTFACDYSNFQQSYTLNYNVHMFWSEKSFQLKYNPTNKTFTLHSGSLSNCPPHLLFYFQDKRNLELNELKFYVGLVIGFVEKILKKLKYELPPSKFEFFQKRFEDLNGAQ